MNYCECGEIVYDSDDRCASCGVKKEHVEFNERQLRLFDPPSKNLMLFEKSIMNK
jgi:hypothetical protein